MNLISESKAGFCKGFENEISKIENETMNLSKIKFGLNIGSRF